MENPLDITTDPIAALMRRVAALEERADSLEANKFTSVPFVVGSPAVVSAKFAELAGAPLGYIIAVIEEVPKEGGGTENFSYIMVNFPSPYGWKKV